MGSVRVAIVGVGNCAASLVQGVQYYRDADPAGTVPGLMHVKFGPYHVRDIEFVAAFDVDAKKVGLDLSRGDRRQREQHDQDLRRPAARRHRAARPHPRRSRQVLPRDDRGVRRRAGRRRRGAARRPRSTSWSATCRSVPSRPRSSTPSAPSTQGRLRQRAAGLHRQPTRSGRTSSRPPACRSSATTSSPRSAPPSPTACLPSCSRTAASCCDRTYQLNVGGNMDFKNMLERDRLESKKISKTQSVTSQHRPRPRRAQRAHRPVRLRAVARRPQVGLRPPRGSRRSATCR